MSERRFHFQDGLFFERLLNNSVRIFKTDGKAPEDGGKIIFEVTIDDGSWASIVLTMSYFNERPNDWHKFMDYHVGRNDLLNPTA